MKKLVAGALAGAVILSCAVAEAQIADFGFRGGYQRMASSDSGGGMVGAFLRKDWQRVIFVEAAVMYHSEEVDYEFAGVDKTANLEFIPVQLSLEIFPLKRNKTICPYLLAGGGLYITRVTAEGEDESKKYKFGWHLGLGADWVLTEDIFLEGDFRYVWLNVDTKDRSYSDALKDFDSWMASIGLGFRL